MPCCDRNGFVPASNGIGRETNRTAIGGRSRQETLRHSLGPNFAAERRAKAFGLKVHSLKLENPPYDFDAAFRTLVAASPQMLLVLSSPHFTPSRARIAELAISNKLPTMFIFKTYAEAGGLLSYGADYIAMHRQAATQVVKILRGTRPADIPIEQPNRFEFVVNLKTAKAIGIELPTSILLRADEVIE
jgi:putative ABC transport system substrate-binding protein